jgi:hypothetical protein
MHKSAFLVLAAAAAGAAAAQQQRPDPNDPKAKAPPVEYRSAFEGYRPYAEREAAGWREMNDEARRIGGHVGIMREQAKPAPQHGHGGPK